MSNRRSLTKVVLSNTAVSGTTVYTTSWFPMDTFVAVGAQVVFSGTNTGTLIAEVSYDVVPALEGAVNTPVNFNTVSVSVNSAIAASIAINAASATTVSLELGSGNGGAMSANWVRLKYTNATLTGTIVSATIVGKNAG
jgi:hypothetical protein